MSKLKPTLIAVGLAVMASAPLFAQDRPPMRNMPNMPRGADTSIAPDAQGTGVVKSIDSNSAMVTIAHEPISTLSWPAMTMAFKVAKPDLLKGIAVGSKVEFMLQGKDMSAVIVSLKTVE
jgi:Cu(I)/Ag(I) efflux system protein CusF